MANLTHDKITNDEFSVMYLPDTLYGHIQS